MMISEARKEEWKVFITIIVLVGSFVGGLLLAIFSHIVTGVILMVATTLAALALIIFSD